MVAALRDKPVDLYSDLLHDGRTTDVREAILAHRSPGSEANAVVDKYSELPPAQAQDLLNFLCSL